MAVPGTVYGRRGVDWNSGVLQRGRADDVSVVDASAGAIHVPVSAAGRHGDWQRGMGRVSIEGGGSGGTGMVVASHSAGTRECVAPQTDRCGIEDGSRGGKGLSTGGFMSRRRGLVACWLLLLAMGA